MPSERQQRLARASAESQAHIGAARASCEITREHISDSRNAIARSLALLNLRYSRAEED
jgi:hypothetical protein